MDDLTKLYSPSCWSKRFKSPEEVVQYHIKSVEEYSLNIIRNIQCELNISYGDTTRQKIDIIGTDLEASAPILIFIHGGYWQTKELSRFSYHFIAKNLHQQNIKTAFIGYDLCPEVTIFQIFQQIQNGIKKCLQYAKAAKSKGVFLMGHSAGAHLIALFLSICCDYLSKDNQLLIKGAILTSGVYDLSLFQKTVYNEALNLNEQEAIEMSPLRRRGFQDAERRFYVIVGQNESTEFIRQSEEFSVKLREEKCQVEYEVVPEVDHFDIIEKLVQKEFAVTKKILDFINY